jgi:hypothetical protein
LKFRLPHRLARCGLIETQSGYCAGRGIEIVPHYGPWRIDAERHAKQMGVTHPTLRTASACRLETDERLSGKGPARDQLSAGSNDQITIGNGNRESIHPESFCRRKKFCD